MDVIQVLVVIFGVGFTVFQVKDIANNQLDRKYDLATRYYDKLGSGTDEKISIAIEHKKAILTPKGNFTTDELDNYLDDLDGIGEALGRGLLDEDTVCSDFSDLTLSAHDNSEIAEYITKVRVDRKDNAYFGDVDSLYNFISSCQ